MWRDLSDNAEIKNDTKVALVDCGNDKDICVRYRVQNYPTFKFFVNGKAPEVVRNCDTVKQFVDYVNYYKENKETPRVDGVYSFTNTTFFNKLGKRPLAVKFFAPWSQACKDVASTWINFAKENDYSNVSLSSMTENNTLFPFFVGEVDCSVEDGLCKMFGVKKYPSIRFIQTGDKKGSKFKGEVTLEKLQKWANECAQNAFNTNLGYCLKMIKSFKKNVKSMKDNGLEDDVSSTSMKEENKYQSDEIEKLKKELDEKKAQIEVLRKEIDNLKGELGGCQQILAQKEGNKRDQV